MSDPSDWSDPRSCGFLDVSSCSGKVPDHFRSSSISRFSKLQIGQSGRPESVGYSCKRLPKNLSRRQAKTNPLQKYKGTKT